MLNPARCVYYFDNRFFFLGNAFAAGEANFGQAMYQCLERSPQYTHDHPRVDLCCDGFQPFGLCASRLSKSSGFVSVAGKASLVSIFDTILFLRS